MANMERKSLIRESVHTSSAAGAVDDLVFPQVQPGYEKFVDWVSIRDDSNAITKWEVLIRRDAQDYPVCEKADTAKSQIFGQQIQTWLGEGEKLVVRITGATASDNLQAWCIGHYRVLGE